MIQIIKTYWRVYSIGQTSDGLWKAQYRPINPRTGFTWQASRSITRGHDCYVLTNWETDANSGILPGNRPNDWWRSGEWHSADSGFSTKTLALAAIAEEQKRSRK